MRVIERFSRADQNTINYEFTVIGNILSGARYQERLDAENRR